MLESITIEPTLLAILVGTVLPLLVGVVTKELASGGLKAAILALLSVLAGLGNSALNSDGVLTQEALILAAQTWVVAVATYYGWLKPRGTAVAVASRAFPEKGLGKPVDE